MNDFRTQLIRRLEIVGMAVAEPSRYTLGDFANIFRIDEEMLKKDLQALRSAGIDIHKLKKGGVVIENKPEEAVLQDMLIKYVAYTNTDDKTVAFVKQSVRRKNLNIVSIYTILQRAIAARKFVSIQYRNTKGRISESFEVGPLRIFQREGFVRMLGVADGSIRHFHMAKIGSVLMTDKRFVRPAEDQIEEQFRYSWETWTGEERFKVKLRLSEFWADRLSMRPVVEDQAISRNPKAEFIFTGTVNSLEEISRWILARAGEVVVIEPIQLRNLVGKSINNLQLSVTSS